MSLFSSYKRSVEGFGKFYTFCYSFVHSPASILEAMVLSDAKLSANWQHVLHPHFRECSPAHILYKLSHVSMLRLTCYSNAATNGRFPSKSWATVHHNLGFLCLQCPNLRNTVGPKSHKLVQVSPATSSLTSYFLILLKGIRHYCSLFSAYAHSCIYNCY